MDDPPAGLAGTVVEYWPPHDWRDGEWNTERAGAVCDVLPYGPWLVAESSCTQVLRLPVRGLAREFNGPLNH
jgi:hypothetical protein